jgi:transposase-like protein
MKRRTWSSSEKLVVVLEGIKGRPVAELCTAHQISQSQYYQWRDQFLKNATKAFEVHSQTQKEARMEQDIVELKEIVAELMLELKKTGDLL